MRILFFVPYVPGVVSTRPRELLRGLVRRGHEVTLATLWSTPGEREQLERWRTSGLRVVSRHLHPAKSLANAVAAACVTSRPMQADYCWHAGMFRLLCDELSETAYDIVHVTHLRGARYLERVSRLESSAFARPSARPAMIWDAIDSVGYLLDQARRQSAVLRWRLAGHIEHRRTRRYECSLPPLFDAVLVSSARDRDEIGGQRQCAPTSGRVCILPNGVDTSTFVPSNGNQAGSRAGTPIVTLSGALDYHPNVTAAIRLAERIMPLVWIDRPEIRLRIVGAAPGRRLLGMGGSANGRVEVLGDVVDIAEQLRIASAVAAPLSYGAGTQFKILEALSCGAPTVTSTQVARRLGATPGRHLLAEDDDHDIVRSIIRLTDDTDYGRRLGQAGRAFVEQNFGWEGIVGRLEDIYVESVDALRVGVAEPSRSFASVGVG